MVSRHQATRRNYHVLITTLLAVILIGTVLPALAAVGEQLFDPSHVAKLRGVTSVQISPDGKHVAYTMAVQRKPFEDDDGPAWVELHVVDPRGNSRPFVTGKVNVGHVRWTPDSKAIAFLAKRGDDEHRTLYRLPIDGGEARPLISLETDLQHFVFSRDGQRVALLAKKPMPKQRKENREKGFNQKIYEEDWRPTALWIAQADGSGEPKALELDGSVRDVSFNPVRPLLAVVITPTPAVDDSYMYKRISLVDADTGKVLGRVDNQGKLGQIGFSPDGKHLAIISGVDIHDPYEGHLMIATVPGDGALRDLTPDLKAHVSAFAWKDAQTLTWVVAQGTGTTLGSVNLDGQKQITAEIAAPVFRAMSLSDDGRTAALVGHDAKHPTEVFWLAEGSDTPKRLTHSNPWLDEMRFAKQEVVRWKARDGLELEGVLVYPLNYEPGHRYPLIMAVHGGPESHVPNGWVTSYSMPGQVGAARGFAVLYPNYRGSTGRGVEFSKMGQADAAGKEFDDIVDAIDHLAATGLVDKDKVGITGGSYGGYASAWGATYYSDRYAASVMFVGISDNISKLGTTDIPDEMYLVHHLKRLWEDWDYFLDRSPIRYVQRNRTPTLILHGDSDPRVHPSQSLELHRHLKTLAQAPVRLVLYPGEGHGNRRAAARYDYNLRLLRWMEHYLQGPGGPAPNFEIDYGREKSE